MHYVCISHEMCFSVQCLALRYSQYCVRKISICHGHVARKKTVDQISHLLSRHWCLKIVCVCVCVCMGGGARYMPWVCSSALYLSCHTGLNVTDSFKNVQVYVLSSLR